MINFYFNSHPKTREKVISIISSFNEAFERSYATFAMGTFGHNVLDDYNLEDSSILWCLRNENIQNWYQLRELELYPKDASGRIDQWDLYELDSQRDDIIMFLRWLMTIDENIRLADEEDED